MVSFSKQNPNSALSLTASRLNFLAKWAEKPPNARPKQSPTLRGNLRHGTFHCQTLSSRRKLCFHHSLNSSECCLFIPFMGFFPPLAAAWSKHAAVIPLRNPIYFQIPSLRYGRSRELYLTPFS